MDDYSKILEKEKILKIKKIFWMIQSKDKLSKHQIISKMYEGLVNEIEELKGFYLKI